nr:hypothetical protein [Tanacetum cinerariifolium]
NEMSWDCHGGGWWGRDKRPKGECLVVAEVGQKWWQVLQDFGAKPGREDKQYDLSPQFSWLFLVANGKSWDCQVGFGGGDNSFFIISSIAVQTPDSGISNLLAVGTTFTGSGNLYCQWEFSPGSGNALCILFLTVHIDDKLCFVEEPVEVVDSEVKRLK